MNNRHISITVAATSVCAILGTAQANLIESTFDTDLEGWTVINDASIVHVATGGNDGGYARFNDAVTGALFSARVPTGLLGNLSAANGQSLSFDAQRIFGTGASIVSFATVTITGTAGSASLDLGDVPPIGEWTTYATTLDAATWGQSESAWADLLADVTNITIQLEGVIGDEAFGLDNFIVVPTPATSMFAVASLGLIARRRRA